VPIFAVAQVALLHTIEVGTGETFQVALSASNAYFVAAAGDGVLSLRQVSILDLLGKLQRETGSGDRSAKMWPITVENADDSE
jgi:hypothetical protein